METSTASAPTNYEERLGILEEQVKLALAQIKDAGDDAVHAVAQADAAKGMADSVQAQFVKFDRHPDIIAGFGQRLAAVEAALKAEGKPVTMPERDEAHENSRIALVYTCGVCGANQSETVPGNRVYNEERPCPVCGQVQRITHAERVQPEAQASAQADGESV